MTITARIPVEDITEAAAQVRPGRVLLEVVAAPFYVLGWLAFWLVVGGVRAVVWLGMAVKFGWVDARDTAAARGLTMPVWSSGRAEVGRGVGTR